MLRSVPFFNNSLIVVAPHLKRRMIFLASTDNFNEEISMRRFYGFIAILLLVVPALVAQEHYTEGPVWRVQLIRVKPNQMDAYLSSLRQSSKAFFEEEKRQGIITDYKIFFKETKSNPQDWDIAVAIQYKNRSYGWRGGQSRSNSRQSPRRQTASATAR
jgi:hypothetical protein